MDGWGRPVAAGLASFIPKWVDGWMDGWISLLLLLLLTRCLARTSLPPYGMCHPITITIIVIIAAVPSESAAAAAAAIQGREMRMNVACTKTFIVFLVLGSACATLRASKRM